MEEVHDHDVFLDPRMSTNNELWVPVSQEIVFEVAVASEAKKWWCPGKYNLSTAAMSQSGSRG